MKCRPKQAPYPALELWQRRGEHPRNFATWRYDALWRAACSEAAAVENTDNPQREQRYQKEAIASLLDVPECKVKLDSAWTRQYVARLTAMKNEKAA